MNIFKKNKDKQIKNKPEIIIGKEIENTILESWDDSDLKNLDKKRTKLSFATKFFLISLAFFVMVIAIVAYLFLNQTSNFSEKKIIVQATSVGSVTSGEAGEINVQITNNNKVPIVEAYLTISYNSGENISGDKNMVSQRVEVGQVLAHSVSNNSLNFSLYGSEGTIKNIQPVLHYKLADSKAEFTKDSNLVNITLKSSPVILNVESLKEIHQDYNMTFTLNIKNNTNSEIKDLIITARNPSNFIFASSSETLLNSTPSWKINLMEGESKVITMTGKITGNIGDQPSFTFYTGVAKDKTTSSQTPSSTLEVGNYDNYYLNIDNIYSKVIRNVKITGQYLGFNLTNNVNVLNQGNSANLAQGEMVTLDFNYQNNLGFPLSDLVLSLNILGDNIDKNTMKVIGGYYDPNQNIIIWNKNSNPDLAKLGAYQNGNLEISFRVKNEATIGSIIEMIGQASGNRNSEDNVSNLQDISFDKSWIIESRQY